MGKDAKDDQKAAGQQNKDKAKHHNKLMQDIEKARQIREDPVASDKIAANKKPALEPLKNNQKPKLEPLPDKNDKKKLDPFEDLDLLDLGDDSGRKKEEKKQGKAKKPDSEDFDFEFEDIHPDEGSKIPPDGNKMKTEPVTTNKSKPQSSGSGAVAPSQDKDTKKDLEIEIPQQDAGNSKQANNDEKEEDEYIIIDGKRFREIQIEGEEDEFLMDDDGNIYDKEGVYIGTAKDGGEEEEEEDEHPDK